MPGGKPQGKPQTGMEDSRLSPGQSIVGYVFGNLFKYGSLLSGVYAVTGEDLTDKDRLIILGAGALYYTLGDCLKKYVEYVPENSSEESSKREPDSSKENLENRL